MVAIVSNKREFIFKAVADMYTDVARHPLKGFHFPTGRLACLLVGYPAAELSDDEKQTLLREAGRELEWTNYDGLRQIVRMIQSNPNVTPAQVAAGHFKREGPRRYRDGICF